MVDNQLENMKQSIAGQISGVVSGSPASAKVEKEKTEPEVEEKEQVSAPVEQPESEPVLEQEYDATKDGLTGEVKQEDKGAKISDDPEDVHIGGHVRPGDSIYAELPEAKDTFYLKQQYRPVEPYPLVMPDGNSYLTNTANRRKAMWQYITNMKQVKDVDWAGYYAVGKKLEEPWAQSFGRSIINFIPQTAVAGMRGVHHLANDVAYLVNLALKNPNALEANKYFSNVITDTYDSLADAIHVGYSDRSEKGAKTSALILGQVLTSVPAAILGGPAVAGALSAGEGLSSYADIREGTRDLGYTPLESMGMATGGGLTVAGLSFASNAFVPSLEKVVEQSGKKLFQVALEDPKLLVKAITKNSRKSSIIEAITEPLQDDVTALLASGGDMSSLEGKWDERLYTMLGSLIAGAGSTYYNVRKTAKNAIAMKEYSQTMAKMVAEIKKPLMEVIKSSNLPITEETVDNMLKVMQDPEFGARVQTVLQNAVVGQFDKIPQAQLEKMMDTIKGLDADVELNKEYLELDRRVNAITEKSGLQGPEKALIRFVMRGVASWQLATLGVRPSQMQLPDFISGFMPKTLRGKAVGFTSKDGKRVFIEGQSSTTDRSLGEMKPAKYKGNSEERIASAGAYNAILEKGDRNAMDLSQSERFGLLKHELYHWAETATGLKNVGEFMDIMTELAESIVKGATEGKSGRDLSEAYAYAMQFAGDQVKKALGLSGPVADYINFMNAMLNASQKAGVVSEATKNYLDLLRKVLSSNKAMVDKMVEAYGTEALRGAVREFIDTGNYGVLTFEDLKALDTVLKSVADKDTQNNLADVFESRGNAESFMQKMEEEYDNLIGANRATTKERAANREKAKKASREETIKKADKIAGIEPETKAPTSVEQAAEEIIAEEPTEEPAKEEPAKEPKAEESAVEEKPAEEPVSKDQLGKGYTLHSGGAKGSDTAWGNAGKEYGIALNHYYYKEKTPSGNVDITDEQYNEGLKFVEIARNALGRSASSNPFVTHLLSRNWQQVKNSDSVFAVGMIENKNNTQLVKGGTGYAIEMAKYANKPIYVYDINRNHWYTWNYDSQEFRTTSTPTLTPNFAGIGTREITPEGEQAIRDVFEKTFGTEEQNAEQPAKAEEPKQKDGIKTVRDRTISSPVLVKYIKDIASWLQGREDAPANGKPISIFGHKIKASDNTEQAKQRQIKFLKQYKTEALVLLAERAEKNELKTKEKEIAKENGWLAVSDIVIEDLEEDLANIVTRPNVSNGAIELYKLLRKYNEDYSEWEWDPTSPVDSLTRLSNQLEITEDFAYDLFTIDDINIKDIDAISIFSNIVKNVDNKIELLSNSLLNAAESLGDVSYATHGAVEQQAHARNMFFRAKSVEDFFTPEYNADNTDEVLTGTMKETLKKGWKEQEELQEDRAKLLRQYNWLKAKYKKTGSQDEDLANVIKTKAMTFNRKLAKERRIKEDRRVIYAMFKKEEARVSKYLNPILGVFKGDALFDASPLERLGFTKEYILEEIAKAGEVPYELNVPDEEFMSTYYNSSNEGLSVGTRRTVMKHMLNGIKLDKESLGFDITEDSDKARIERLKVLYAIEEARDLSGELFRDFVTSVRGYNENPTVNKITESTFDFANGKRNAEQEQIDITEGGYNETLVPNDIGVADEISFPFGNNRFRGVVSFVGKVPSGEKFFIIRKDVAPDAKITAMKELLFSAKELRGLRILGRPRQDKDYARIKEMFKHYDTVYEEEGRENVTNKAMLATYDALEERVLRTAVRADYTGERTIEDFEESSKELKAFRQKMENFNIAEGKSSKDKGGYYAIDPETQIEEALDNAPVVDPEFIKAAEDGLTEVSEDDLPPLVSGPAASQYTELVDELEQELAEALEDNKMAEAAEADEAYSKFIESDIPEQLKQKVVDEYIADELRRRSEVSFGEKYVRSGGEDSLYHVIKDLRDGIKGKKINKLLSIFGSQTGLDRKGRLYFGKGYEKHFDTVLASSEAQKRQENERKFITERLTESIFKNQKNLDKWKREIKVKKFNARIKGEDVKLSRDEIITLYGMSKCDLQKDRLNAYENKEELFSHLTEEDKKFAEIFPVLKNHVYTGNVSVPKQWFPTTRMSEYSKDFNFAEKVKEERTVRIQEDGSELAAIGAYQSILRDISSAAMMTSGLGRDLKKLREAIEFDYDAKEPHEGIRPDYSDYDLEKMKEMNEWAAEIRDELTKKLGKHGRQWLLANIDEDLATNSLIDDIGETAVGSVFGKLTRNAAATALSLSPIQAFQNLGNYHLFLGLSESNPVKFYTVDLMNAMLHIKDAWNLAMENSDFKRRLQQSGLSEHMRRTADAEADSFLSDLQKALYEKGLQKGANVLSMLDTISSVATKWGLSTNVIPDFIGIALGNYAVFDKLYQANRANREKYSANDLISPRIDTQKQITSFINNRVSSSNYMTRSFMTKWLNKHGLGALVMFQNDQLQKIGMLSEAIDKLQNHENYDEKELKMARRDIIAFAVSTVRYIAMKAGWLAALAKIFFGDDLSDEEKEYLFEATTRETLAQIGGTTQFGNWVTPVLQAMFDNKQIGLSVAPQTQIQKLINDVRKMDVKSTLADAVAISGVVPPMPAAVRILDALAKIATGNEYEREVGFSELGGRSENTAMRMHGYTKSKKTGEIRPKKSLKEDKE